MPAALDLALLDAQIESVQALYRDEEFLHDSGTLVVHHRRVPARGQVSFCLRYDYGGGFGEGPPSVLFCDPATLLPGGAESWPLGPEDLFKLPPANGLGWICTPATREGVHHHPEWAQRGLWNASRPLESTVFAMRELLQHPRLQVRGSR